jgi:hypothetical protein
MNAADERFNVHNEMKRRFGNAGKTGWRLGTRRNPRPDVRLDLARPPLRRPDGAAHETTPDCRSRRAVFISRTVARRGVDRRYFVTHGPGLFDLGTVQQVSSYLKVHRR